MFFGSIVFKVFAEGEHGNVISFTPPLTMTEAHLARAVNALKAVFASA